MVAIASTTKVNLRQEVLSSLATDTQNTSFFRLQRLADREVSGVKKLETIVIDIPSNVFEVNGTPIGKDCHELTITFKNGVWEINYTNKFFLDGRVLGD